MVNRKVPFRTFPSRVCTFVGSTPISRFSSSCRMYFGNGVSAHPGVLAYASDAGPALVGFPVFAVNQVGVDRHLTWAKAQCENGVGQKKKSSFIQPFRVCVSDFRAATSIMVFKKFTPIFQPMSIEKSKFTVCSQYIIASVFRKPFTQPFSLFTPPQILRGPSPLF